MRESTGARARAIERGMEGRWGGGDRDRERERERETERLLVAEAVVADLLGVGARKPAVRLKGLAPRFRPRFDLIIMYKFFLVYI